MNLLQVQNGFKQYGQKILFQDASLAINEGEHVGVIGPNGAGKTTLFKILVDLEHLDEGNIIRAQGLRIGYLEQESDWSLELSAEEFLEQKCITPLWDLKKIGTGLGLTADHFAAPLHALSGGYRMRMKLLYLIGQEPTLMLLDEPTNFLDLESILVLEKFLQEYRGAFLLISHDREFLRRTTEATLEVELGDITKFPGHIDDYFEQKAQLQEILKAQAANQEAKRQHLQSFVDRFSAKATKARQAQSRMKQLEKMEIIEIKNLPVRSKIKLHPPTHTGKEIINLQNANLGYESTVILKNVNLRLERGNHLGVVGFNGAGKSTLLKSLGSRIPLLSGSLTLGHQVSLSYFAQHVAEDLHSEDTVLSSLQKTAHSDMSAQDILNMAGALLFPGEDVYKKIKVLSGGEKARVALGQILLKKSPFLIMDEPTNHLDFDTVEALTDVLGKYEGTLVVVSHDRSFIRRVSKQILEIRNGQVEVYPGTYDDYVWSLEKGTWKNRASSVVGSDGKTPNAPAAKFNFKESSKALQNEIRELEKKIARGDANVKAFNLKRDSLNEEILSAQGTKAQSLAKNLALCSKEIDRTEEEIINAMESLEIKQRELQDLKQNS